MTKNRKRGIAAGAGGAGLFGGLAFAGRKVYRGARSMGMKRRTAARAGMAAGTRKAGRFGTRILRSPGRMKSAVGLSKKVYKMARGLGLTRGHALKGALRSMR